VWKKIKKERVETLDKIKKQNKKWTILNTDLQVIDP
jgi:hypothetical protein